MLHYSRLAFGGVMEKDSSKRKPNPLRIQLLRGLPREIKESFTKEEVDAILYEDIWPDSLIEKLKGYFQED
jgi:hypothetical protein